MSSNLIAMASKLIAMASKPIAMACKELQILEEFDRRGGFLILRLHGVLFFGNTHSLSKRVQKVKSQAVIIDFSQVISIDSSAFSKLGCIRRGAS